MPSVNDVLQGVERDLEFMVTGFRRADPGILYGFQIAELYRLGRYPFLRPNSRMCTMLFELMLKLPLMPVMRNMMIESTSSLVGDEDIPDSAIEVPESYGLQVVDMLRSNHVRYTNIMKPPSPPPYPVRIVLEAMYGDAFEDIPQLDQPRAIEYSSTFVNPFQAQPRAIEHSKIIDNPFSPARPRLVQYVDFSQHLNNARNEQLRRVNTVRNDVRDLQQTIIDGANGQNVHIGHVSRETRAAISAVIQEYRMKHNARTTISKWFLLFRFSTHRALWTRLASISLILANLNNSVNSYGCSEIELLQAVLWKIDTHRNKRALFETLGYAIASAVETFGIVCHTGKMTRLISVVQYMDLQDVDVTPAHKMSDMTPALRAEVMQLAGKVRQDWLDTMSQDKQNVYISGDVVMTTTLQNKYLIELNKEYEALVDDALMGKIIEESVDYF